MDASGDEEQQVPSHRSRLRRLILHRESTDEWDRVHVEYFSNERSLKERLALYFIKNQQSSLIIRLFNVFIKLLSCALYVARVVGDTNPADATCAGCAPYNYTNVQLMSVEEFSHHSMTMVFYPALFWVDRQFVLWVLQVAVAFVSLGESIMLMYLNYKGSPWQLLTAPSFWLELWIDVPFIVTIFYTKLRNMYVPVFLNCWLAKTSFQIMLNDLNRTFLWSPSALFQQMAILLSTVFCLVFTSTCGLQHLQRAGRSQMDLFQSFYFVIVTFSTVGYGDLYPDIWLSQLYVVIMICVAFVVLPTQLEQLAYSWMERQKSGGAYSRHRARTEKHVVVTSTCLQADVLMDFLNEFYSDPQVQDYFVVVLTPTELDYTMRLILQSPLWAQRVIYIQGFVLKHSDLQRARLFEAEACFILANRNYAVNAKGNKSASDEHTILRSWAVKDFAPHCKQYVQLFRPESKMHVKHAEFVVCEDEFKYALLANNCLCPGISTFLTLLLHTSRGEEGQASGEIWHRLYGRHSGNEIYHIRVGQSRFFGEFVGKTFTYASFHAHRKFGIGLIGLQGAERGGTLLLNPGPWHILSKSDICYYMSITKEEHSTFTATSSPATEATINRLAADSPLFKAATTITAYSASISKRIRVHKSHRKSYGMEPLSDKHDLTESVSAKKGRSGLMRPLRRFAKTPSSTSEGNCSRENTLSVSTNAHNRRPSIAPVPESYHQRGENDTVSSTSSSDECESDDEGDCVRGLCEHDYVRGFPPVTPYIGTSATLCHLMKEKQPLCCLQLAQICDHCLYRNAKEYNWKTPAIILASDVASSGIYNFIVPLRAHYRPRHRLYPIVLLLESRPNLAFLDAVSWFPMIYWMLGSINCLDDLLRAGITMADHVVVANKESSNSGHDDYLADCNTIVAVQSIYRLFPSVHTITELSLSSNMRFMQFNAKDIYALHQSKIERKERERGSHISYMFRLPFAAGSVFSASMLDTLMYQLFVKDYLLKFVRLLLGMDQAMGSGYLASLKISESDMWIRTYGRLYQKLCSSDGIIPMAIYRTQAMDLTSLSAHVSAHAESARQHFDSVHNAHVVGEHHEIANMVKCRMENLGLPVDDYSYIAERRGSISYVIINPSFDQKLEPGDIVYVLKPSNPQSLPTACPDNRFRHALTMDTSRGRRRSWRRESRKLGLHKDDNGGSPHSSKRNRPRSLSPAFAGTQLVTVPTVTLTESSPLSPRRQGEFEQQSRSYDQSDSSERSLIV